MVVPSGATTVMGATKGPGKGEGAIVQAAGKLSQINSATQGLVLYGKQFILSVAQFPHFTLTSHRYCDV